MNVIEFINEVFPGFLSGAVAGLLIILIIKPRIEKSIGHSFDKKLKSFEYDLRTLETGQKQNWEKTQNELKSLREIPLKAIFEHSNLKNKAQMSAIESIQRAMSELQKLDIEAELFVKKNSVSSALREGKKLSVIDCLDIIYNTRIKANNIRIEANLVRPFLTDEIWNLFSDFYILFNASLQFWLEGLHTAQEPDMLKQQLVAKELLNNRFRSNMFQDQQLKTILNNFPQISLAISEGMNLEIQKYLNDKVEADLQNMINRSIEILESTDESYSSLLSNINQK